MRKSNAFYKFGALETRVRLGWLAIFVMTVLWLFSSCGGEKSAPSLESEVDEKMESDNKNETSREVITELIGSFSTPIEMALMIKQGDFPFNKNYLLSTDSIERFSNNYSKAMAMGAYGANMGYINIYEKSLMAVDYLGVVRVLAKELDLEHLFDFRTMLELASNASNIDTLITMSTKNFNDMDIFLREKGRDELSVLMILGTWLEGTSFTARLFQDYPENKELYNRIAEQKVSFEKLIMIMRKAYPEDEFIVELTKSMSELEGLFKKINIEYIYKEPIMKEVNGELVIEDQSEMKIDASPEIVKSVSEEIINLRNLLLN